MDLSALVTKAAEILLGLGVPGILILGLAYLLWRSMKATEDRDKLITELQEKRIAERTTMLQALADNTAALGKVASATNDNNHALEALRNSMETLARTIDLKRIR